LQHDLVSSEADLEGFSAIVGMFLLFRFPLMLAGFSCNEPRQPKNPARSLDDKGNDHAGFDLETVVDHLMML
jgi:hypothetical protein